MGKNSTPPRKSRFSTFAQLSDVISFAARPSRYYRRRQARFAAGPVLSANGGSREGAGVGRNPSSAPLPPSRSITPVLIEHMEAMDVPPFMDRAVMGWMLGDDETGRSTPLKTKLPKGATERVTTHYDPLQLRRLAILIQEKAMPQCEIQPDYLRFALDRLLESPEAFASTVGVHEWEALEAQYEMQRSAQFIDEMKEFLRNTEQSLGALDDDDVAGRERLRKVAEKFLYGVADCPIARDIMKLFR